MLFNKNLNELLFDFCCSAKMRDSFTGSSSICTLCKVNSCVNKPLFRRQHSLPNQMSHPNHVKLICDKHAVHESPLRNVLLSDSDISKTHEEDDDDDFHEKFLGNCQVVSNWNDSVYKDINFDSDLSGFGVERSSVDNPHSSSEDLSTLKTGTLLKKTRFRLNDWRSDSDQTENNDNPSTEQNTDTLIEKNTELGEQDTSKGTVFNPSTEETENQGNILNNLDQHPNNVLSKPSNNPSNNPDPPSKNHMFLKCKSQVEVEPSVSPSSALPPSDYGERTHGTVQPPPQGSKRPPFSRSLSNADVQPDERGGELFQFQILMPLLHPAQLSLKT